MSPIVSLAAAALAAVSLHAPEVAHFPGGYFESHAKSNLQQRVMDRWPGPAQLAERWRSGGLDRDGKLAVLLGASAFHDPILIPLYREAVTAADEQLRLAAAYGYRDLLGDALPNLAGGLDAEAAASLAAEMDAVAATLRTRPLVEMWLQAALATEGKSMPGWRGTVLLRPAGICFRAVDRILGFDDFRYVMIAYRTAEQPANRASLLRLLEAVSLQRFVVKPTAARTGWGTKDLDEALAAGDTFVEYWLDRRCTADADDLLRSSFATMGGYGFHPRDDGSFPIWIQLLRQGPPTWRAMVARQLYLFGGQWPQLSILRAESKEDEASWERLLDWYGLRAGRGSPSPGPRRTPPS
jgi:hypothetical protein